MIWFFAFLAFSLSFCGSRWLAAPGNRLAVADLPNERSLHAHPVPRGGGLAILAAIFVSGLGAWFFCLLQSKIILLAGTAFFLALVSYLDDRISLPVRYRLALHFAASLTFLSGGFPLLPAAWAADGTVLSLLFLISALVSLLALVWFINLYNFMDGMDGLAGGMAVAGFGFLAWFGWQNNALEYYTVALLIAGASLGFLCINFPPARLFMGDVGSVFLGFCAGALALWGLRDGIFPLWVPLLIFSPFIVDATVTLLHRQIRGERIWQAHRTHHYQRLVQAGWGQKKTLLVIYVLMAAAGCSALLFTTFPAMFPPGPGLMLWTLLYIVIFVMVNRLENKRKKPLSSDQVQK